MAFVCIDELVSADHLLRKIDKHIDFSFIYDIDADALIKPDVYQQIFDEIVLQARFRQASV